MIRDDRSDVVFKTLRGKYGAIIKEIDEMRKEGRPILVGTTSIEKNEIIDTYLKKKKIPHNVLNAKNHEKEAMIIAGAGKPGAVTVATNMAGRGVDIVLGGAMPDKKEGMSNDKYQKTKEYKRWQESHDEVIEAGGLHVIGTERHESRRIDNQLRGRSGRQGDPGSSRFYLSLEDDLMRIFGGEQISGLMERLKLPEDQPIENRFVSRAIEQAQVKVEGFHFDMRKNLVEYDDVANQQREIVYKLRRRILESDDLKEEVLEKLKHQVDRVVLVSSSVDTEGLDKEKILVAMMEMVPFDDASKDRVKDKLDDLKGEDEISEFLFGVVKDVHAAREKSVGEKVMRQIEKFAYLGAIDRMWIDHIDHIDGLREGVRLRGYAQKDPVAEFKNEAFTLFEGLIDRIDDELSRRIFRVGVARPSPEIPLDQAKTNIDTTDQTGLAAANDELVAAAGKPAFARGSSPTITPTAASINKTGQGKTVQRKTEKPGRNDPCPCGSGKKYKKCHYPEYG
jgi:preprotein translocase subunit SecA